MLTNSATWGTVVTARVDTDRRARVEWFRKTPRESSSSLQCVSLIGGSTRKFMRGIFALCFCLLPASSTSAYADAVTDWNAHAGKAAIAACLAPFPNGVLQESRMYAMMYIAIHDALNAINRRSKPYVLDLQGPSTASIEAAVAAAARDVLVPLLVEIPLDAFPQECIDAGVASVEADYVATLSAIPDGDPKTQGIAVGHAAAASS